MLKLCVDMPVRSSEWASLMFIMTVLGIIEYRKAVRLVIIDSTENFDEVRLCVLHQVGLAASYCLTMMRFSNAATVTRSQKKHSHISLSYDQDAHTETSIILGIPAQSTDPLGFYRPVGESLPDDGRAAAAPRHPPAPCINPRRYAPGKFGSSNLQPPNF
ncbi:hypothetical protein BDP55DRAFT_715222 [Colletotrichum godetiae]|uniref:Uncharacterized protein n=1 Tax=Colletotrichum godetiae TaxID=1209918 RepID=A0AAJ0AMK6_9PEZI|nr:uncharacterized protein BDP55DRAFT_715222 [Colletotrichum godetiae]KAK1676019.1 hypothetical protein BDP55DRAFT_715222 [Colletotrichum godetiae]